MSQPYPPTSETETETVSVLTPAAPDGAQVLGRLVRLATQADRIQAQLDALWIEFQASNDQLSALTRYFTSADAVRPVEARLAELLTRQETADQQLADLTQTVTKLTRTQFKANTLGESKEQHVAAALAALQEMATRRQQAQEAYIAHDEARLAQLRSDARSELAADFLPALDGLELALEHGRAWIQRRRQLQEESTRAAAQAAADAEASALQARQARWLPGWLPGLPWLLSFQKMATMATLGVWSKLRRALVGEPASGLRTASVSKDGNSGPLSDDATEAVSGWLQGLELVRERFVALLAAEGIRQIEARGRIFDPRLHLAVAAEIHADVPAGLVVSVQRKGYRQRERVIRYAEVTVARAQGCDPGLPSFGKMATLGEPWAAELSVPTAVMPAALRTDSSDFQEEEERE